MNVCLGFPAPAKSEPRKGEAEQRDRSGFRHSGAGLRDKVGNCCGRRASQAVCAVDEKAKGACRVQCEIAALADRSAAVRQYGPQSVVEHAEQVSARTVDIEGAVGPVEDDRIKSQSRRG